MPTTIPPADILGNEHIPLKTRLNELNVFELTLKRMDTNQDGRLSKTEAIMAKVLMLTRELDNAITKWLEFIAVKPAPMPNTCNKAKNCAQDAPITAMLYETAATGTERPSNLMMKNAEVFNENWLAARKSSEAFGYREALEAVRRAFPKGIASIHTADVLALSRTYMAIPYGEKLIVLKRDGHTI